MATTESISNEAVSPDQQIGYSIDPVRYSIWNDYKNLGRTKVELFKEYAILHGSVKVKTALKALNELSAFIEDSLILEKNKRYYHNKQLEEFEKFMFYYFVPQFDKIGDAIKKNSETMDVGENGFSLIHYGNWKNLAGLFVEVSGISKFERVQPPSAEFGYGAS